MSDRPSPSNGRLLAVAVGWVVLFTLLFYVLPPQGGSAPRGGFWPLVPFQLLDLVDPPPPEPGDIPAGWGYVAQRFDLVAVAAFVLLGGRAIGSLLLRCSIFPNFERGVDREVFAWGLGLSVWSLVVLLLGLFGAMSVVGFAILLAVALVADVVLTIRFRSSSTDEPERVRPPWWFVVAAIPFVIVFVLGAALPLTEYDAKGYHLLGPKEFHLDGHVGFLSHNVYTSFPFLTEMLTLSGMVLRGDWLRGALVGKVVLSAFGPLTSLAVFALTRSRFGVRAGWIAALVYLTTPWTYTLSTTSYVEGALSCFTLLTLFGALRTADAVRDDRPAIGDALLTGLMAGSAMACKYPAAVTVVLPAGAALAIVAMWSSAESQCRAGRLAVAYALGVALTVGPWLLKNVVETGNPVYPLASSVLGGRDLDPDDVARWHRAHSPDDHDLLGIPGAVARVTLTNDRLGPLLYAFAPLTLLLLFGATVESRRSILVLWAYIGFAFVAWWALTHRIDRFWVPMLPVVAVLAGAGTEVFDGRRCRMVIGVVAGAIVAFQLAFVTSFVTSGLAGHEAYLADLDVARERVEQLTAPAVFDANQVLPEDAVVLCVGEAQVFDARFRPVYNTVFDRSIFIDWFADADASKPEAERSLRPTEEIRATLDEQGVTHVLVNWTEIARYRAPGSYGFSDFVTPGVFDELVAAGLLSLVRESRPRPDTLQPSGWRIYEVR